jgi:hypothetical protein
MTKPLKLLLLTLSLGCASQAAAQLSLPSMVSGLPNVSHMSAGNAAGVLQYCAKNKLVSSTSSGTVLDGLKKKPNVTSSPDFAAGQAGNILSGGGKSVSLAKMQPHLKSQACDMVLKQGKHLL